MAETFGSAAAIVATRAAGQPGAARGARRRVGAPPELRRERSLEAEPRGRARARRRARRAAARAQHAAHRGRASRRRIARRRSTATSSPPAPRDRSRARDSRSRTARSSSTATGTSSSINRGAQRLFAHFPPTRAEGVAAARNLVLGTVHPDALQPYLVNWQEVAGHLVARLHREVAARPADDELAAPARARARAARRAAPSGASRRPGRTPRRS